MAYLVEEVLNNTDAELDVKNSSTKSEVSIAPKSSENLQGADLLDLTFVSQTSQPVFIKIVPIEGESVTADDTPVNVEAGDPEDEIDE